MIKNKIAVRKPGTARRKQTPTVSVRLVTARKNHVAGSKIVYWNSVPHDSNDSVVVARYLNEFRYDPERKAEVLSHYNELLATRACVR